ncbi:MAG: hypothetical protein IKA51_04740 [Clostridia bacterium]|nr:hypothetical protein [Clostridia bacterium]
MVKKYILTFLNFLFFLATATVAAACLSYLVKLGIIVICPYVWLRNLCNYLVMTAFIFFMMFLTGSNMGYRRFSYSDKLNYKLPIICMIIVIAINFYIAMRFYFDIFACGPVDSFVALCLNASTVGKSDYTMYPPAMLFAVLGFLLNGAIYTFAACLGMRAGYKDKIEDELAHFKLKLVMAKETVTEATETVTDENTKEE